MYGANESAVSEDKDKPRFIRITDINEDGSLKDTTFKSLDLEKAKPYLLKKNDILFARTGATVGKTYIHSNDELSCFAGYLIKFESDINKLLPKLLFYYSKTIEYQDWIRENTIQATIQNVSAEKYKELKLPIFKMNEQDIVISFLDRKLSDLNFLIYSKEKQIKLLEEQRQAMITEAITKGLNPNAKMKDSGVEWIGEIPEHWEVKKIKHLSQVKRGASPRPIDDPKYYAEDGDYSWVRISDVTKSGKYLFNTRDKLSELGASKSVKRHRGDLFLSIAATVGKACITKIDCCIHDGFVYFDNLKVEEEYLFYIFEAGQCYRGLGKMGTQLNLNTDTVGNITIPVSSRKEIQEIIDYITNKDVEFLNLINAVKRSKEKLKEYRQSLIHEAVTGKILIEEMEAYIKEAEKNGD